MIAFYGLYRWSRSASLVALFATEPFAFPQHFFATTITLPKVVLTALAVGVALDIGRKRFELRLGPSRFVLISSVAFVLATTISMLQAANLGDAVRETFKALEYALLIFVAWYIASTADTRGLGKALPLLVLAVCVIALLDFHSGYKSVLIVDGIRVPRLAGLLEGPNQLGGWIALLFPFALVLAASARTRFDRSANTVAVFVAVVTAVLTFSRASVASMAVEWICVVAFVRSRSHIPLATIIIGATVVAFSINGRSGPSMFAYFSSSTQETHTGGVGTRPILWNAAITLWKQHPILGLGAGNFEDSLPLAHVTNVKTHSNNVYLQAAVEGGIPLFISTLGLLLIPLIIYRPLVERSLLLAATYAAVAGFAMHGLLDDLWFFPKVAAMWCLLVGVASARADRLKRDRPEIRQEAPIRSSLRLENAPGVPFLRPTFAEQYGQISCTSAYDTLARQRHVTSSGEESPEIAYTTLNGQNTEGMSALRTLRFEDQEQRGAKISVVLPAYNESKFISKNVLETVDTLRAFQYDFEVIVVDDGSSDMTHLGALGAKALAPDVVRVVRYDENRGKGHALLCGASYACGDLVVFLDADMDLHPSQLPVLLELMRLNDADVVIGSKLHPLSKVNYPMTRRLMSVGYYALVRLLFGLPVRDTQTGIKVFRSEVLQRISTLSRSQKFAFDLELLCLAHLFGYRLIDAPVTLEFRRGTFGRIRIKDVGAIFRDTIGIFVRLRIFQRIVKDVAGLTTQRRLSGTEQPLPTVHADASSMAEADHSIVSV